MFNIRALVDLSSLSELTRVRLQPEGGSVGQSVGGSVGELIGGAA